MEAVLECCCGLDVHRDNVVACILKGPNGQKPERTIKTFSSLPDGLKKLRSWLEEENCRHAAMENTGVYWQPVYTTLEDAFDGSMVVMVVSLALSESATGCNHGLAGGIGSDDDHSWHLPYPGRFRPG